MEMVFTVTFGQLNAFLLNNIFKERKKNNLPQNFEVCILWTMTYKPWKLRIQRF